MKQQVDLVTMTDEEKLQYYLKLPYKIEVKVFSAEDGGGIELCMPQLGRDTVIGYGEIFNKAYLNLKTNQKEILIYAMQKDLEIPIPEE